MLKSIILIWLVRVSLARLPETPCKDVYSYERNHSSFDGVILVTDPPPLGTVMVLEVTLSTRKSIPPQEKATLILGEKKWISKFRIKQGLPLKYRVVHPIGTKVAAVVKILFNGKEICSGPSFKSSRASSYKLLNIYKTDTIKRAVKPVIFSKAFNESDISSLDERIGETWDESCGIKPLKIAIRIFGGESTSKGDWPWLVALFNKKKYICGASLISRRMVLTAAHCVSSEIEKSFYRWDAEEFTVRLGVYNISDPIEENSMTRYIKRNHIYPHYNMENKYENDIALLEMAEEVIYNNYIKPVCLWNTLPDQRFIVDRIGTVVGWGKINRDFEYSELSRSIKVPIVSLETCRSSSKNFHFFTSDHTICAGSRDGTGPCKGDSGSGLYLELRNRWVLRGVVSISLGGSKICDLNNYVVFTDVAKYTDWITKIEPALKFT